MAHLTMGHGVSWCFGTNLAPNGFKPTAFFNDHALKMTAKTVKKAGGVKMTGPGAKIEG
jgi:hypothetical protein